MILDTHALLWWLTDHPALPAVARGIIADADREIWVSAACAWEIATKVRVGRLAVPTQLLDNFGGVIARRGFREFSISVRHAALAGSLEGEHRDPFDRMLAAQGKIEGMPVITRDSAIAGLGAQVVWDVAVQ